jgi:hypothetical protein
MKGKKISKNIQYVIPVGNAWMVKSADSAKFTLITDNKREAVAVAKEIAKNSHSDLVIYGKNGQILTSNSYKAVAKA